MSSHKEAPTIAQDPVADSTDVYAFVTPNAPDTVTLIANYIPLEDPDGGPNFFEFGAKTVYGNAEATGDDVLYEICIDNTGSGVPSLGFQFQFTTHVLDPDTFLYNTGPITHAATSTGESHGSYSATWNRRQSYMVNMVDYKSGKTTALTHYGDDRFSCPPCNIGVRSTPNYESLSEPVIYTLANGIKLFAGQRAEGFFVDLGSIFDLADLRPLSSYQAFPPHTNTKGINSLADKNVHSIAMQIPIALLTSTGKAPSGPNDPTAVIGVHTKASRQKSRVFDSTKGTVTGVGPYQQVSRLGNPLVNEAVIPMGQKDFFNSQAPVDDSQFAASIEHPELQGLLVELYPGVFPNLAKYTKPRLDLVAIFGTGIPGSLIGAAFGVGTYQGGKVVADQLRLNMAIKPTGKDGKGTSNLGLLGGDLAGFPNGRRVTDDVVTIELQAVAGATIPLVDSSYTADAAVPLVSQGVESNPRAYRDTFPFLGNPHGGFSNPVGTPPSNPNPQL